MTAWPVVGMSPAFLPFTRGCVCVWQLLGLWPGLVSTLLETGSTPPADVEHKATMYRLVWVMMLGVGGLSR